MDYGTELEHEATYDTAVAVKTPHTSFLSNCGDISHSVDELKKRMSQAKSDLSEAIDEADAEKIIALRSELNALPVRITATQIAATKTRLEEIESEMLTCDEKIKLIRSSQVSRKIELQEKIKELDPYWEKYNACGLHMSFVNNDIQLLRGERVEKRALLFSLSEKIKN